MTKTKNILFLFNLSMDLDNPILATTNLWANEFAKNFEHVYVYSTHVGRYHLPANVKVTQLGGGTLILRIAALTKLVMATFLILRNGRTSIVFHHQSPRTSVFPGFVLRLAGINQGLWYSHSSRPISLLLGSKIVDKIFSSTPESLPVYSKKSYFLGHGVDTVRAQFASKEKASRRDTILFIGRISPIKQLEELIFAIADSGINQISFVAIGPTDNNQNYRNRLYKEAKARLIDFSCEPALKHDLVFARMAQSNMFFAGMKNSVDKSCLEAAASGCFVITTDIASAKLSGMTDFWELINGSSELPKLSEQIRVIMNTDSHSLEKFRMKVQSRAIELNSASELIARITQALREVQ